MIKCPYHDCQKDYNPKWDSIVKHVYPSHSFEDGDGLLIDSATCKFCDRQFHSIYRSKNIVDEFGRNSTKRLEMLFTFPSSKTTFTAKTLPKIIKENFNEAERCRSIGSLTGVGACLRKTIYSICDDMGVDGVDYRQKISNLPVKGKYQELLKQIKWLGDITTKPGEEKYTMTDADLALQILPLVIEELYSKDEKIEKVEKILAKVNSKKN